MGGLKRLQPQVPGSARAGLEEHLQSLRGIEGNLTARLSSAPRVCSKAHGQKKVAAKEYVPLRDFAELGRLHLDLLRIAFACDLTRVASFVWSSANSTINFQPILPTVPPEGHHLVTHQGVDALKKHVPLINRWYHEQYARFAMELNQIPEGEGALLDQCLLVIYSELAQVHTRKNMPFVVVGSGGGRIKTGQYLRYPGRSTNDLYSTLLEGVLGEPTQFGDIRKCNGILPGLLG